MQATEDLLAAETIEIIAPHHDPLARWQPVAGSETLALLDHLKLPQEGRTLLLKEAVTVLGRCRPRSEPNGDETGLVIGYVQSGKTMSFTTVAALAHDNGYRLIIVATGLTRNLFEQSRDRLKDDLRLGERRDRKWLFLENPKARDDMQQSITMALDADDGSPSLGRQTIMIAVMKNRTHLNALIKLLKRAKLDGVPALVIDDEADQASLNNDVRKGKETATYRRIIELRQLLPHHTFLQYTATPQAMLLINIIDVLSPNFAEVLTPGQTYTGGKVFFDANGTALVRAIPTSDIPTDMHPLSEPPESLLKALRIFFLGVASGMRDGAQGNRSMMVHPAKKIMQHADYCHWVRQIQRAWSDILAAGEDEPDYHDLLNEFRTAHDDLSATLGSLPSFAELVPSLKGAVKRTLVTEVNASRGQTPQPDWRQIYSHIVVGGEVLNRGYTIEGLTVTYMPRGKGLGQADTIQQRARWFGYKAGYIGFCRVYLSAAMVQAYQSYVHHEDNLRKQMREYRATGNSLREWRRAFFLSPDLRPTRNNVIDLEYVRGAFSNSWYDPKAPHDSPDSTRINRTLVDEFIGRLEPSFHPDEGHTKRTAEQRHRVASSVSLHMVYEDLLTQLRVTRPGDATRFTGLLLQLGHYLDQHPDETCSIYQMSPGYTRRRSVGDDEDEIKNLFQGANYDGSEETYPGDQKIRAVQGLSIQFHNLRILRDGATIADNVPAVTVWVPKEMAATWVSQHQGN